MEPPINIVLASSCGLIVLFWYQALCGADAGVPVLVQILSRQQQLESGPSEAADPLEYPPRPSSPSLPGQTPTLLRLSGDHQPLLDGLLRRFLLPHPRVGILRLK